MLRCVVVLAGGASRRLGQDKLAAALGDRTVLDQLLDGLGRALPDLPVVCVGPPRATQRQVTWLREDPPGGGPVAGLACALDHLDADGGWLAVVAGDQPLAATAVAQLATQAATVGADVDALLAADGDRPQPLLAVYRVDALRVAIGEQAANRSVRSVVAGLRALEVPVPPGSALDVDTPADLDTARRAVQPTQPSRCGESVQSDHASDHRERSRRSGGAGAERGAGA